MRVRESNARVARDRYGSGRELGVGGLKMGSAFAKGKRKGGSDVPRVEERQALIGPECLATTNQVKCTKIRLGSFADRTDSHREFYF